MDSRVVAREVRRQIWPLLRREGFTQFSSKTAWRFTPDQIHVVNYRSFSTYGAFRIGCTTFSFCLNLGIYLPAIPDCSGRPQHFDCHIQHVLRNPGLGIWYVDRDGRNVLECIENSRKALERDGLPWFARFDSLEVVLTELQRVDSPAILPALDSPIWRRMIGYAARRLGRSEGEAELKAIFDKFGAFKKRRRSK